MNRTLAAILTGFCIDCLLGDPHSLPHPVVLIGKLITALETRLRAYFPKDADGERKAGGTAASGAIRFSEKQSAPESCTESFRWPWRAASAASRGT